MSAMSFHTEDEYSFSVAHDATMAPVIDQDDALDLSLPADASCDEHMVLESLLDQDFTWEEALGLMCMRARIAEIPEMYEHPNMQFARWLYDHGRISEDSYSITKD